MNVLSLFDGMSCGQIALNKLGIKVDNYFACEIDKFAIKVTQKNFPNTVQLGSVTDLHGVDMVLPKLGLIIGGSPCQGFSFAGKQLNFEDPRSMLFFEFVRILEEARQLNPDVLFMLENVRMKKEYQDVISKYLGVQPIEINSALVSAQNRKRLFWTNIPNITQPEDKGILLRDIIHEQVDELIEVDSYKYAISAENIQTYYRRNKIKNLVSENSKSFCQTATAYKGYGNDGVTVIFEELAKYIVPFDKTLQILDKEVERGKVGYFRKDSQANRVYYIHNKSVTLCGEAGGGAAKMGQYLFGTVDREVHQVCECKESNGAQPYTQNRVYNTEGISPCLTQECGRTNISVPLFGCITPDRVEKRQNGQRFNEGKKFYTLKAQDRHGILIEGYIRKLTPIECERLQTVPDHYTDGVSNSQRYKMLGNGWTVDVISHIFKNIKHE